MTRPTRILAADSLGRFLLEFLVIVVGVLTALGADAWWTERQEREDEERILRVVLEDLRLDSAAISGADTVWGGWETAAGWATENLGRQVPADSAVMALEPLFWEYFYPNPDAGYTSLTGAGRLDIVSDDALQTRLVQWYERDQAQFGLIVARVSEMWLRMVDAIEMDTRPGTAEEESVTQLTTPWSEVPTDPRFVYRIYEIHRTARNVREDPDYGLPRYRAALGELRSAVEAHLETLQ